MSVTKQAPQIKAKTASVCITTVPQLLKMMKKMEGSAIYLGENYYNPIKDMAAMYDLVYVRWNDSISDDDYASTIAEVLKRILVEAIKKDKLLVRMVKPHAMPEVAYYAVLPADPLLGLGNPSKNYGLPAGVKLSSLVPGTKMTIRFLDSAEDCNAILIERDVAAKGARHLSAKVLYASGDNKWGVQNIELTQVVSVGQVLDTDTVS